MSGNVATKDSAWIEVRKNGRILLRCSPARLIALFMATNANPRVKDLGSQLYRISLPFEVATVTVDGALRVENVEEVNDEEF